MFRYAIGYAERSGPHAHIGWLSSLATATDQPYNIPYNSSNPGGPSIKVNSSYLMFFGIIDYSQKIILFVNPQKMSFNVSNKLIHIEKFDEIY